MRRAGNLKPNRKIILAKCDLVCYTISLTKEAFALDFYPFWNERVFRLRHTGAEGLFSYIYKNINRKGWCVQ